MTEETLTNLDIEEVARDKARAQEKSERAVRRGYVIGLLFLAASILSAIANFVEFRAWQILVVSLADIASFVLLFRSFIHFRNNRQREAHNLIPIAILLTFTFNEIFYSGNLTYNLIGGLILFAITYLFFEPEDRRRWFRYAIAHTGLVLIFGIMSFLPKFAPDQDTINFAIISATFVLMIWQLLRRFQIRSIQMRLLLIMLGLALIPIMISGVASTLIDLRRDTQQAENYMLAIAQPKESQINSWMSRIGDDLRLFQNDETFETNLEFLSLFTPTEEYREQLKISLLNELEKLRSATPKYSSLSIVSPEGEILTSSNSGFIGNSIPEIAQFSRAEDISFGTPSINPSNNKPQTQVYFPIYNDQEVLLGYVMGSVTMGPVIEYLEELFGQLGETGEIYLVTEENMLLTPLRNTQDIAIGSEMEVHAEDEILEETEEEESHVLTYENYTGEEVLGLHLEIPELNSTLIVEQNQQEAFNALRLSMIINVVITVITLIISISFAVVVSRNFAAPIEEISKTARKVLRGEETTFPEVDRVDEIGTLTNTLSEMTSQLLATTVNLEQTVTERTEVLERRASYLETTSQISRATTGIYELTALLNTVAQLISENFGFYHVGIFIHDDRDEFSVLRASNSEGGWKMLARGHKLEIGTQGIVGYVTGTGEPRVQQQVVGEDSVYFDNPDLPLTRSEMALPLKVGDDTFGALDVQSEEEQAFSDEDVAVLQTLADAVAVTIQNTRLIEQLQENLEAERRLFGEITKETWTTMLSRGQQGFSVRSDVRGTQMVTSPSTETGKLAMKEQMPIIGNLDEELHAYPAALPVTVRGGATIGVIETQKPEAEGPWTQEEISILEKVSSELGLALDNARLFEETQRRAQRDRIAAELSTKIWSSSDVENILQTAVSELGSALNVSQGQIRLSLQDGDTPEPDEEIENITDGVNQS